MKARKDRDTETDTPHWTEWLVGAISTLLVLLLLAWISYDIYRYDPQRADFKVTATAIEPLKDRFRVSFDIQNISQTSAAQVRVVGELKDKTGKTEHAVAIFDYVAAEAKADGALFFKENPEGKELELQAESYIEP